MKTKCVMLCYSYSQTNRTCQMQCLQQKLLKNLACTTCEIGNGSSNLLVLPQGMACTKALIGCHGRFLVRKNDLVSTPRLDCPRIGKLTHALVIGTKELHCSFANNHHAG